MKRKQRDKEERDKVEEISSDVLKKGSEASIASIAHTPSRSNIGTPARSFASTPIKLKRRLTIQLSTDDTSAKAESHTPAAVTLESYDYTLTPISLYSGHSPEEVSIINSKELITEKALNSVLDQVKALSKRENIMNEVSIKESETEAHSKALFKETLAKERESKIATGIRKSTLPITTGLEPTKSRRKNGRYEREVDSVRETTMI